MIEKKNKENANFKFIFTTMVSIFNSKDDPRVKYTKRNFFPMIM